ncbi:uncharacterized protein [Amphiura filiformis]|uniref:uncharacterized protein n=1 Tax=Amphiura filiformis TaxID=82378 RepID=UPI003B227020
MELSDIVLRRISTNLGTKWEKLASYLEFTQAEIEQFVMESTVKGTENAIYTMLVAWREKQPVGTTDYWKKLKNALEKCGRCDIADIIHADLQTNTSEEESNNEVVSRDTNLFLHSPDTGDNTDLTCSTTPAINVTGTLNIYSGDSQTIIQGDQFNQTRLVSPKAQLDDIHSSLTSKLETKPELFEDAINAFYTGYVAITSDPDIAAALINFGQSIGKEEAKEKVLPLKKWKQLKKIPKISEEYGDEFSSTTHITCHNSGEYAVVDDIRHNKGGGCYTTWRRVHAFGEDGSQRFVLNSNKAPEMANGLLNAISGVAVTKQGYYAITDCTAQVKLFDTKGQNVGGFSVSEESEGEHEAHATCIAVNSNGEIYVGDFKEQVITIHNADDFTKMREIYVSIKPSRITINKYSQICVVTTEWFPNSGWFRKAVIFDHSGNEILTLSPTIWGKNAMPLCVVYDEDDMLLLGVFDRSINRGGHVHRYGKTGEFLDCIIKGIAGSPSAIALKSNTLAIAVGKSVLIYKGDG